MSIRFIQITKKYKETIVFQDFSTEFAEHETICIMGSSGGGKTTLLHILMGLVKPDAGKVEGMEGKRMAAVFQENRLCEGLDALKNVQMVCDKKTTPETIEAEFEKVGLKEYKNKPVSALSGGMKRRVAIVRALMAVSDVVIMDEPFKGLDEELKEQVMDYVKVKTQGKTLLVVTHEKTEAEALNAMIINL